jgi:hypothetical protein
MEMRTRFQKLTKNGCRPRDLAAAAGICRAKAALTGSAHYERVFFHYNF